MKITHASWEQLNMNISAYEVELEVEDTAEDLYSIKNITGSEYTVVKVPPLRLDLSLKLQELGFFFVEAVQSMAISSLPALTAVQERMRSKIIIRLADHRDMNKVFAYIENGLFSTDRISADPIFSSRQAADRYKGWINHIISHSGQVCAISYCDTVVGFFVVKPKENNVYESVLAAVFPDLAPLGLGSLINHVAYEYCFSLGAKEVRTTFSLNNTNATSVHASFPLKVIGQHYVFRKYSPKKSLE